MRKNFDRLFEEYTRETKKPKQEEEDPVSQIAAALPPKTLHEYSLQTQDHADVIFIKRLEETERITDRQIRALPPPRATLAFTADLAVRPPWINQAQDDVINSYGMKFPLVQSLTREYIIQFRRAPGKNEFACINEVCECQMVHGFRARALITDLAIPERTPPNIWCELCHLAFSNSMYLQVRNGKVPEDKIIQIHAYQVYVNVPGEYRQDQMLTGEGDVKGVFGNFPVYNVGNYEKYKLPSGLWGYRESDHMVFRLPQAI
jgi:hypothetical protein